MLGVCPRAEFIRNSGRVGSSNCPFAGLSNRLKVSLSLEGLRLPCLGLGRGRMDTLFSASGEVVSGFAAAGAGRGSWWLVPSDIGELVLGEWGGGGSFQTSGLETTSGEESRRRASVLSGEPKPIKVTSDVSRFKWLGFLRGLLGTSWEFNEPDLRSLVSDAAKSMRGDRAGGVTQAEVVDEDRLLWSDDGAVKVLGGWLSWKKVAFSKTGVDRGRLLLPRRRPNSDGGNLLASIRSCGLSSASGEDCGSSVVILVSSVAIELSQDNRDEADEIRDKRFELDDASCLRRELCLSDLPTCFTLASLVNCPISNPTATAAAWSPTLYRATSLRRLLCDFENFLGLLSAVVNLFSDESTIERKIKIKIKPIGFYLPSILALGDPSAKCPERFGADQGLCCQI